ncbi:hypothetical protein RHMOL_Rhmol12G0121600 [Rhododendron molle]|uniref:Uncharacterized protein n=1 Tax=Rhododendron molle TaxID=49168 RepID=A0ACC0LIB5_RHOML|nr:hypothetical protein RHMOL_Rhmol12G0121600 [Rhododendron molle]
MTSLCDGIHIISTNKKEGNVHPLKWRVNKTQLCLTCSIEMIGCPFKYLFPAQYHYDNIGCLFKDLI